MNLNKEFHALWKQCIDSAKRTVDYHRENKDKEMVKFSQSILEKTKEEYEKVCKNIKTS